MTKESVLNAVLQSDELPTLPAVASQLIALTSKEDTTLTDIADLISKDIGISAKILKVSNSAFYSFPQQIGSIHQAVPILGTNAVRSLVLSFSFLSLKGGSKASKFDFEQFWQRSLAQAVAAKLIIEKVNNADSEEIFISGLLQNLGELIFAKTFPVKYGEVLKKGEENEHGFLELEEKIIGANHCQTGFEVAKNWGFPDILLSSILYHHSPSEYKGKELKIRQAVNATYLSDILTHIMYSAKPEDYYKQFRKDAKKMLRFSNEDIEGIIKNFHHEVELVGNNFGLKINNTRSIQEILQEANIRLSLLNLNYDQMNKQLIQTKLEIMNLTKELEEKNRILNNLAYVDGLTEVFNHRYFQNCLDQEISRSQRNDNFLSLIFCDIDDFKTFNDNYGHQAGDFVLKEFCRILTSALRKYDILARYGGEEFAIILPETEEKEALSVAERLRKAVEETAFDNGSDRHSVTASFGVAVSRPSAEDRFTKDEFIKRADLALYSAKKSGRNRVQLYSTKKKWFKFS